MVRDLHPLAEGRGSFVSTAIPGRLCRAEPGILNTMF